MAEAFLQAGSRVAVCGRRDERLAEVRARHPEIDARRCDVAGDEDRRQLLGWAEASLPGLNVLVNNAGIQRDVDFTQGIADFLSGDNELRINLEAPIMLSGLFVPLLSKHQGAAIINVSSGLGFVPAARMPVYSAAKAGMHAYSMALRHQLSAVGIKVFEVVPPAVDTELNATGRAKRPGFKAGVSPAQFVAAVMQGLEHDVREIGFGMTAEFIHASRADLDERFRQMNSRM
jgi:uncharacterized oxidoreductase